MIHEEAEIQYFSYKGWKIWLEFSNINQEVPTYPKWVLHRKFIAGRYPTARGNKDREIKPNRFKNGTNSLRGTSI